MSLSLRLEEYHGLFYKSRKIYNKYFEHEDVVSVTTNDNKVIVGSVMMSGCGGSFTSKSSLALDISEKFHNKRKFIYYNDIKNIQKINE